MTRPISLLVAAWIATAIASAAAATGSGKPKPTAKDAATSPADASPLGIGPCEPSGRRHSHDYEVGEGKGQLDSLDKVPWESLGAGDTVRIHWRKAPYAGKFLIAGKGTADAPVRVCGVPSADGTRPVITGRDAVTRRKLADLYGTRGYQARTQESRSVIFVSQLKSEPWSAFPEYIQIDGLAIRGLDPAFEFTDSYGEKHHYTDFAACVWIERGHHVVVADNEISGCTQAIFSKSTPDGDFTVTRDIRIAGNDFHDNGVVGDYKEHTTYIQSVGAVYEFNRYGPLRAGALGNSIKDRSVGTVIRYNRIEAGAHAIDLVEAEDYADIAKADPAYRSAWVYGNQIIKDGATGSMIHYGGDHAWSEANYRKGTLYFYDNTVRMTGSQAAILFQLSTVDEKAEVWNNVFVFDASVRDARMRSGQETADGIATGGILELGRNWITSGWRDSGGSWLQGKMHPLPGKLEGSDRLIEGSASPVDPATLAPLAGSAVIGVGEAGPDAASGHPVRYQLDASLHPVARSRAGRCADLGAVEHAGDAGPGSDSACAQHAQQP